MNDKSKNLPITADFYLGIPREQIIEQSRYKLSLKDFSGFGTTSMIAASAVAEAVQNAPKEGLYRCVFPEGVTGNLATFNDGSGYLGTIMQDSKFVGQAHWIPEEGMSAVLAINPVTIAIAAAMAGVNRKLDYITEYQEKILQFLHDDKETQLEAMVNSLADITNNYRFNQDNTAWKTAQLSVLTTMKGTAEHHIIFYRRQIKRALKESGFLNNKRIKKLNENLLKFFKYYRMSVYIFGHASFLEIMVNENFDKDYLNSISTKLRDYKYQYMEDYTAGYNLLEQLAAETIENKIFDNVGQASKNFGKTLEAIPVMNKGTANEVLIAAGEKMIRIRSNFSQSVLEEFCENKDSGTDMFIESIDNMNQICNEYAEVYLDQENLYICI